MGAERVNYKDGIGAERCETCHQMLRDPAGAQVVPVLLADVEQIAVLLSNFSAWEGWVPHGWRQLVQGLEQAAGRTVQQIKATR